MTEITEVNEQLGVFNAIDFHSKKGREKLIESVEERGFFIIILDESCKEIVKHKVFRDMITKACWDKYFALAITTNGKGMKSFKDTFHRTSLYVDKRMFPLKNFKMLFENEQEIIDFFVYIQEQYGEIHIKGIHKIIPRESSGRLFLEICYLNIAGKELGVS